MAFTVIVGVSLAACADGGEVDGAATDDSIVSVADVSVCGVGDVDGDLYLYAEDGLLSPDLLESFAAEFGVAVVTDSHGPESDVVGKLQSGAAYDLVTVPGEDVPKLLDGRLIAEIQRPAIPNVRRIDALFRSPPYDEGGRHSVAFLWGTYGLGINGGSPSIDGPRSWGLVFDPASAAGYAGGILMIDDSRQTLGAALLYLGFSANSTDGDELVAASTLLTGVSDYMAFASEVDPERFAGDVIRIAHGRSEVFRAAAASGTEASEADGDAEVGFFVPSEGAIVWTRTLVIPTTTEHTCTALTFIDYLLDPKNAATTSNWARLATTVGEARAMVDPALLDDPAVYPPVEDVDRYEILGDVGRFEDEYDRQFALARS